MTIIFLQCASTFDTQHKTTLKNDLSVKGYAPRKKANLLCPEMICEPRYGQYLKKELSMMAMLSHQSASEKHLFNK